MKKINFFNFFGLAIIVSLVIYNVSLALNINNDGDVALNNIEKLAHGEDAWNPYCHAGGPGSEECGIEGGVEIGGFGASVTCNVKCKADYYACCGLRCTCKKEAK